MRSINNERQPFAPWREKAIYAAAEAAADRIMSSKAAAEIY